MKLKIIIETNKKKNASLLGNIFLESLFKIYFFVFTTHMDGQTDIETR